MTEEKAPQERPRRPPPPKTIPKEPGVYPVPGMRKVIAKRLTASMQESPHFYLATEIDMEPAAAFREKKKAEGVKISYNDFILKAVGLALREHPHVNAYFKGDEVEVLERRHVGMAVALDDGLVVPVLRDVDTKTLEQISAESLDLATRAREGKLQLSELQGGGITVSNLGMFDVDFFTAIINPPQSTILAVGSIKKVPVVVEDEIKIGLRLKATLSSDHRMVDGALAAKFMVTLKEFLQNPGGL
jgi:pyruvate dehydrogenase E2 component (dihydrolipoamide acetyltransferase)